jgi:hypothetical protein
VIELQCAYPSEGSWSCSTTFDILKSYIVARMHALKWELKDKRKNVFWEDADYCAGESAFVGRCAWDNLSLLHYKFTVRSSRVGGRRTAVFACFASPLHCSRISPVPTHPTVLPVNKDRLPQSTRTLLAQALVATWGHIFPLPPETGLAFTMLAAEPKKMRCSFAILEGLVYYWPLQTSLYASIEKR